MYDGYFNYFKNFFNLSAKKYILKQQKYVYFFIFVYVYVYVYVYVF